MDLGRRIAYPGTLRSGACRRFTSISTRRSPNEKRKAPMKITQRVLSLIAPAIAATSLFMGCGGGDTVQVVNNVTCPEAGQSYCNSSASGVVCAEGSTRGVEFVCAQGEVCEEGACVGQCEADATECVGEQAYRRCSSDGRQWVPVACQASERCEDGACVEIEVPPEPCAEGAVRCDNDGTRQVCEDGSWEDESCPSGTECTDGACVGVCTVGETRCDPSTHNLADALFGATEPNFNVLWTCKDGLEWTVEPCAQDALCTYSGLDPAEVDAYRRDLTDFMLGMYLFEASEGMTGVPQRPDSPTIPQGTQASCVPDACAEAGEFFEYTFVENPLAFFESPAGVRQCGSPEDDEETPPYGKLTECRGLPPYEPMQLGTVVCDGGTACAPDLPQDGCREYECAAEETACDGDSVVSCDPDELHFELPSLCDYGCTETGSAPEREASCNPAPEL